MSGHIHTEETAQTLNYDLTLNLIPVIAIIGLICVFGSIGNLIVLYIYYKRYPKCNFRHFVLVLAGIDFVSCMVLMPLEIVTLLYWFVFPYSWLCKCKSFLNAYTVTASSTTLLLIAIDRYRKVCKPHSKQIQPAFAVKLTALVLLLALIPATSDGVFWGTHTDTLTIQGDGDTANSTVVGVQMCEKDDAYKHTLGPVLHTLVLYGASNCIIMLSTLVLYILIAVKLFLEPAGPALAIPRISVSTPISVESDSGMTSQRESIFRFPTGDIESGISESEDLDNSTVNLSDSQGDVTDDNIDEETNEDAEAVENTDVYAPPPANRNLHVELVPLRIKEANSNSAVKKTVRISGEILTEQPFDNELQVPNVEYRRKTGSRSTSLTPTTPKSPTSPGFKRHVHRRRSTIASLSGHTGTRLRRKTLIMFILTIIFVVTMLLYFSLIGYMSKAGNFVSTLDNSDRTAWMFFLRLYFINSVINPVLYGFLDPRFRKAMWKMGVRFTWVAGSVKRNISLSIKRSSSGRGKHDVTVIQPNNTRTRHKAKT